MISTEADTTTLVRTGSGAWDLTSDARLAFRFFSLVPNQLPGWAGTHNDVPIIEWSCSLSATQIHTAVLPPLGGAAAFQVAPSPVYPHILLFAERLLSTRHRLPSDWWLHSLTKARTSTTFPCPLQLTRATARRRCVCIYLHSTGCCLVCPRPFREHEQDSANLGLAIRRAVTDLTSSFTFPPILDSHPRCRGSCKALKARPLLTARLRLPLRGTPNEPR